MSAAKPKSFCSALPRQSELHRTTTTLVGHGSAQSLPADFFQFTVKSLPSFGQSGGGTFPSDGLQFDPDGGVVAGLLPPSDVMIDLRVRQSRGRRGVQEKMIEP